MQLKALVLSGYGINCENESRHCIEKTGGKADIVHLNKLIENPGMMEEYNLLLIPGGFSYGDDLGSGKVFANKMKFRLREPLEEFIKAKKLVAGICNGFQILVKMGLLPVPDFKQRVTFTVNESGKFEDRWVFLKANKESPCIFTKEMEYIYLPVRHGEGKFVAESNTVLTTLENDNLVALRYVDRNGKENPEYPFNPNGAVNGIAGICDKTGRVFGMMPHPEAFNMIQNCPLWTAGKVQEAQGLKIFRNAVEYVKEK
jgi:phosphoribosylformylglycinamidine synthase